MPGIPRPRRSWWLLLAAAAGLLVLGVFRAGQEVAPPLPASTGAVSRAGAGGGGYAEPSACARCHGAIAASYALTGMARSFSRLPAAGAAPAGPSANATLRHAASGRDYEIAERDGGLVQRRSQRAPDGSETNVFSRAADYVIGSGNHAKTFVHRAADGRLFQLPVSWYAERGGQWAMSPGYDRADHLDFRRVIDEGCMSCHNGYPRQPVEDQGLGPRFTGALPEGIDCQRCHGPGQAHIDAVGSGDFAAARRAIVNPGTLDRDRQLEVCLQCHLEPTSSPLPYQVRRSGRPAFSYVPGTPLADTFLYFDHAPTAARRDEYADKFEIAGAAYRLAKSACFQAGEMTCLTCHNPHDVPRGAAAVRHYTTVCQSCHQTVHPSGPPRLAGSGPRETCVDCHMPRRRTEDAVHVVMTDHFIQRRRPAADLTAPLQEAATRAASHYRGEVALYYPPALPSSPGNDLHLALAQVQHGANLPAGIPALEQAIQRHGNAPAEFYYELARAHAKAGDAGQVIRWSEAALDRDPDYAPALKELAGAATALGQPDRAAAALERAIALRPGDAHALTDLGNVQLKRQQLDAAVATLGRALALDAESPAALNTLGLALLARGDAGGAEEQFRQAIRVQPDLAGAHNNLGNLLAGRRAYDEAASHFELAIQHDPNLAEAHHGLGLVLAMEQRYPRAVEVLRDAARLDSQRPRIHTDIADVLAAMGRTDEAMAAYRQAIQARADDFEAHLGLGELLVSRGRQTEAVTHFRAAANSPDPDVREAARARLAGGN